MTIPDEKERADTVHSPSSHPPSRARRTVVLALLGAVTVVAVTACGSSSNSSSSNATATTAQECTTVSNVLSDGPDPTADPVGYAQAQVLPLHQLTITDASLHTVVTRLDSAYQAFSSSNGSPQDAVQVSTEQDALNAICPGAAP